MGSEFPAQNMRETGSDFVQGQDLGGGLKFNGSLRHAVNGAARAVLRDSEIALIPQSEQALGAVPAHAGKYDSDYISRPKLLDALEKDIDGRAIRAFERVADVSQAPRAAKDEMILFAGQQDSAGFRLVILLSEAHRKRGLMSQPISQPLRELDVHMLHDYDRARKLRGQMTQYVGQGRRTAGGGADGNQGLGALNFG